MTQNNLGNAYLQFPTGQREVNIERTICVLEGIAWPLSCCNRLNGGRGGI